jgi:hypothetical protein
VFRVADAAIGRGSERTRQQALPLSQVDNHATADRVVGAETPAVRHPDASAGRNRRPEELAGVDWQLTGVRDRDGPHRRETSGAQLEQLARFALATVDVDPHRAVHGSDAKQAGCLLDRVCSVTGHADRTVNGSSAAVTGGGGVVAGIAAADFARLADGMTEGMAGALDTRLEDVGPGDATTDPDRVAAGVAGASVMVGSAVPVPPPGCAPQPVRVNTIAARTPAV